MTCYDEREISIPETHLHSSSFNHYGRSCADRLPSAGRSDTTEDALKKTHSLHYYEKVIYVVYIYTHLSSMAGKHARDPPGNSHLSPLLLLSSCQMEGLFTAQGENVNEQL